MNYIIFVIAMALLGVPLYTLIAGLGLYYMDEIISFVLSKTEMNPDAINYFRGLTLAFSACAWVMVGIWGAIKIFEKD